MIYSETYRRNVFLSPVTSSTIWLKTLTGHCGRTKKDFDLRFFFVRSCFRSTFIRVMIEYHRTSPLNQEYEKWDSNHIEKMTHNSSKEF